MSAFALTGDRPAARLRKQYLVDFFKVLYILHYYCTL